MKKALISGITGQDGAYLARHLLDNGYEVYGTYRRTSTPNFWRLDYLGIFDKINLISADITDFSSILDAIKTSQADEIYHLAAQSFVRASYESPIATANIDGISVLNFLEAIRLHDESTKFYFAGTSEMYGQSVQYQKMKLNEESPFNPVSPYATAKLYGYWTTRIYRESYKLFSVSGILFNHESPLRGLEFVTRKISNEIARIHLGLSKELRLGNMDSKRDWGYAPEYVEGMHLMLNSKTPKDYVLATGESHSVREFVEEGFKLIGKDPEKYVKSDKTFRRHIDFDLVLGDSSKAQKELGWKPKTSFRELVKIMVNEDIRRWEKWQKGERFSFDAPYYKEMEMKKRGREVLE
ncbi:MAG: GDP-mannose 4,6-dehydratase [Candidatus Micrarchaeota archaeon]|nr:GDP-mannose 4,6-dehydratase [Candidatus Micrarchaeota archaeon]MDE1851454.1 GDP-mannose 4,6-dehydratase [Candidatus Micrarchaeota archaeon]